MLAGSTSSTEQTRAERVRGLGGWTRVRLGTLVVAAAMLGLAASACPALAAGKPVISSLKAEPASVDSFGTATVTASVFGASTCTLAIAHVPAAIYSTNVGLPTTFPCEAGPVELTGPMPGVSRGNKEVVKVPIELTASSAAGKKVVKRLKVSVTNKVSDSDVPVAVAGVSTTQVSAAYALTCALVSDGHVECWGDNYSGQLGNGTSTSSVVPVGVTGISSALQVSAGGENACALLSNGHVECWGYNYDGQLGDGLGYPDGPEFCGGDAPACSRTPVEVTGISTATQIAVSDQAACAVLSDGHVECWGADGSGELGDGRSGYPNSSDVPVEVIGISSATEVSAGGEDACALLSDGHVECWGYDTYGQLGNGTGGAYTESEVPVEVTGVSTATEVSAGGGNACALLANGDVECWGYNVYGELGNGTTTNSDVPVEVKGISTATQVSAGYDTCALLSNGQAECWGDNSRGELGNGTTADSDVPVEVAGIAAEVTGISTATLRSGPVGNANLDIHACAALSNGHAECWGSNEQGELGTGGWHDDLASTSLGGEL